MQISRWLAIALQFAFLAFCMLPVRAQEDGEVDLQFQTELTPEYEIYLDQKEEELSDQVDEGEGGDQVRMALILVELAQIQVEAERSESRIEEAGEDIEFQLDDLEEVLRGEITDEDTESIENFLRAVRQRFVQERDEVLEERLEEIFDAMELDSEEINAALEDFVEVLGENLDEVQELMDDLRAGEEPFTVTFYVVGGYFDETDIFEVGRENLDDVEAVKEALGEAGDLLLEALDLLDEAEAEDDNAAAIATLRAALAQLDAALATLEQALGKQPLSLLGEGVDAVEDIESAVEDMRGWVADVDEILGGRIFDVGEMAVRPVALIENRTESASVNAEFVNGAIVFSLLARRQFERAEERDLDAEFYEDFGTEEDVEYALGRAEKARLVGWVWVVLAGGSVGIADPPEDLFREFYSAEIPAAHTFREFFPNGLSPAMLEIIGADMVVNTAVSRAELDSYMEAVRAVFQARVDEDEEDAEAHAGLALIRTYILVADNHQDVEEAVELFVEGDIAGLVERFDVDDFDYGEELDAIREHLDYAREDGDMVFLVLEKFDADEAAPFAIDADDEFVPLPLTGPFLGQFMDSVEGLAYAGMALAEAAVAVLDRAEESFELALDPNLLDFTETESTLDFALALERSNEDFLQITPDGRENLQAAGDDIEDGLVEFSGALAEMRNLVVALDDEGADLGGMADAVVDLDDFYQEMRQDFEDEDMATEVSGRSVNMSAWFDEPPDDLLQRFIWYLDDDEDTDNTLGGLFPDGVQSVILEERVPSLPTSFVLEQNYPNPFNSGTVIRFALPVAAQVRLEVYDLAGQVVETLVEGLRQAGVYTVIWDGRKESGEMLASGIYLYRLRAGREVENRKLILLR